MALICIFILCFYFTKTYAYSSLLTDVENKTSTTMESKEHAWNDVDFLRQMINQETVIRLALVKNVQALVSDVNLMKKSITTSELTITALQQTVETLSRRVDSLEQENTKLKNSSGVCQDRMLDLETRLETVRENVSSLNENLDTSRKESNEKRQEIINKTKVVLDDIKMEVRYLSLTLFDFKEHSVTADEMKDKMYKEMEIYFNTSFEGLQAENLESQRKFNEITASIEKLGDVQTELRREMTENLNNTNAELEIQTKNSEYQWLKLSSSVSALEVFKMNVSTAKCAESSEKVAFTAIVTQHITSQSGQTLVFPRVITNIGGGYNNNSGVFTAPRDGVYVFFCKITGRANSGEMDFEFILNGSAKTWNLVYGRSTNPYRTSSNSIVLQLRQ